MGSMAVRTLLYGAYRIPLHHVAQHIAQHVALLRLPNLTCSAGKFLKDCRTRNDPVSAFLFSYIDIALLLLRFIRSTRQSDWNLQLACIQQILPWMFAYNHSNYPRYLTFPFCQMKRCCQKHTQRCTIS